MTPAWRTPAPSHGGSLLMTLLPLGEFPVSLQKAPVKIINTGTCNAEEAYDGTIEDTMLCAGYMEGNIDACQVILDIIHIDHIVYK